MEKPKHTPGPYFTGKHGTPDSSPQYGIYADGGKSIAIVTGDNAQIDAALFAAAPDLFSACKEVLAMIEKHKDLIPSEAFVANEGYALLYDAVAKAKGEAMANCSECDCILGAQGDGATVCKSCASLS